MELSSFIYFYYAILVLAYLYLSQAQDVMAVEHFRSLG